ncbi:MAG: family 16 glycoside hydrolase [Pirellulaceae bacterium]
MKRLSFISLIAAAWFGFSCPGLIEAQDDEFRHQHQLMMDLQGEVAHQQDQFVKRRIQVAEIVSHLPRLERERTEAESALAAVQTRKQVLSEPSQIVDDVEINEKTFSFKERAEAWDLVTQLEHKLEEQLADRTDELVVASYELKVFEQEKLSYFEFMTVVETRLGEIATQIDELNISPDQADDVAAARQLKSRIEEQLGTLRRHIEAGLAGVPEPWVPLFNGKDLEGWTPKIRGYESGENFGNTFRVEDGVLKVAYDAYNDGFQQRFGHLFYQESLSHYRLRVEYRFTGEQVDGGPGWAISNSGVMLHGQHPESMEKDQDFPVSIEVQLLADDGTGDRPTANVCTPGTHYEMNGELVTQHCRDSTSETFPLDQWVTVEIEVRGDEVIRHSIDGNVVLEYQKPQLDPDDAHALKLIVDGNVRLFEGTISLQSESHPVEFRKIELLKLDDVEEDE